MVGVVVVATALLRRRRVTGRVRLAFLLGGTLVFGFVFGLLAPAGSLDPNPVFLVRSLLRALVGAQPAAALMTRAPQLLVASVAGMLLVLLALVWVSNKSLCGWGCPLGLLQDLLQRVPFRKWKPSFRLSNSVRVVAFGALVAGIALAGLDWIGLIDPFQIFRFNLTVAIGVFGGLLLAASLFVYRPWCQFFCPFGLLWWGWSSSACYARASTGRCAKIVNCASKPAPPKRWPTLTPVKSSTPTALPADLASWHARARVRWVGEAAPGETK